MKKEFSTNTAKFVYTKNESGYQEVLDKFTTAKEIMIITYNISERQNKLFNCLKDADDKCEITIITNIPNRWEKYYGGHFRELACKKINLYMTKLTPEKLGSKSSVFFNFKNHGKIVMTDTIAYVGSENFSEESVSNSEFGFLCGDHDLIDFLKSEVLPDIKNSSVPYYQYDYTELLLEANMILTSLFNVRNQLHDEVYYMHDDENYSFIDNQDCLSTCTIDSIVDISSAAMDIANDIFSALETIDHTKDEMNMLNSLYDELSTMLDQIGKISTCEEISTLSSFSVSEYVDHQLETQYLLEADEEHLDGCVADASDDAIDELLDLCIGAKSYLDDLLNIMETFQNTYSEYIELFNRHEIKKINPQIDNTSL